ncbi:Transcription factor like, partial [Thalictrum thalictroides]
GTERTNTDSGAFDFGAPDQSIRLHVEDTVGFSIDPVFNPTKSSGLAVTSYPPEFGTSNKLQESINLTPPTTGVGAQKFPSQKQKQVDLVFLSSGHIENWGESIMAEASPRTDTSTDVETEEKNQRFEIVQSAGLGASDSSDRSKEKSGDQKTLRRLAQNREAARKSRLRKKAYVQQLESSRLKLTQLEQELQRARQQGLFISNSGDQSHSTNGNGALTFDIEYSRWLEEHNRQVNELRAAVNSHAGDGELRIIVDGIMVHYDEIFKLKSVAAKADVFHILSGMWKTPAERCFLWLGGFRSSELLK